MRGACQAPRDGLHQVDLAIGILLVHPARPHLLAKEMPANAGFARGLLAAYQPSYPTA